MHNESQTITARGARFADRVRHLLVVHLGQMGDMVLALPALRALAAAYPGAKLEIVTSLGGAQVCRVAGFSQVHAIDRRGWREHPQRVLMELPGLWLRLWRRRFDLGVDFHSYHESNLLLWSLGIPRRVAMLRPTRGLPRLINLRPAPDDPNGILLDRYCRVLEPLGIQVTDRVPRLESAPELRERETAWRQVNLPGRCLGVCPGAGHAARRWPREHFRAAIRAWAAQYPDWQMAIFTGPEESDEGAWAGLPGTHLRPGLRVAELTAALAQCELVLSNDSGPAHLAAAAGARVVVLGAIPAFDPVGRVQVVRARRAVAEITVEQVLRACANMLLQS